jgi:hypothetical protein
MPGHIREKKMFTRRQFTLSTAASAAAAIAGNGLLALRRNLEAVLA